MKYEKFSLSATNDVKKNPLALHHKRVKTRQKQVIGQVESEDHHVLTYDIPHNGCGYVLSANYVSDSCKKKRERHIYDCSRFSADKISRQSIVL